MKKDERIGSSSSSYSTRISVDRQLFDCELVCLCTFSVCFQTTNTPTGCCQMLSPLALISTSIKELIPRRGDVPNGSPLSCLCPLREHLSLYQDKRIDDVISPKEAQNHTPDLSSRIDLSCRTWSRFRVGESTAFPAPFVRVCCEFDESEPWEFEAIAAI